MKSFSLIQLYFVLATLTGLILIIIGSVTLVKLGLDQVVGVKPYPDFSAPYPPTGDTSKLQAESTESQKVALAQWEQDYTKWQTDLKDYSASDQQMKRDIVQSLSMLAVGIPVFLLHCKRVFSPKKEED